MEGLTRLVSESLARHGFDRPLDYRRLHWSRWFRCESHHSLLFVPSKPGVFAVAEEIMDFERSPGDSVLGAPDSASERPEGGHSGRGSILSPPSRRGSRVAGDNRPKHSPHARRHPVLRRRRHGLRARPHVVAPESHARPPDLRPLLRPFCRH